MVDRVPKYPLCSGIYGRFHRLCVLLKNFHERLFIRDSTDLQCQLRVILERFDRIRYDGVVRLSEIFLLHADSVYALDLVEVLGYRSNYVRLVIGKPGLERRIVEEFHQRLEFRTLELLSEIGLGLLHACGLPCSVFLKKKRALEYLRCRLRLFSRKPGSFDPLIESVFRRYERIGEFVNVTLVRFEHFDSLVEHRPNAIVRSVELRHVLVEKRIESQLYSALLG